MLSIRIDNGPLLAGKVQMRMTFWQRHWPTRRPHLSADQGLLLIPARNIHSFGMPCPIDVVFLDCSWRVLRLRRALSPRRWAAAPRKTAAVLMLAAGRCEHVGLRCGMVLHQDAAALRAALPCATTLLRRSRSDAGR